MPFILMLLYKQIFYLTQKIKFLNSIIYVYKSERIMRQLNKTRTKLQT